MATLGNMSFSNLNTRNAAENNNNSNLDNNELNAGERGASPLSLPASPSIPIPQRIYTPAEEEVINKFVDYVRIRNVNDKPYLTKTEKELLNGIFWSPQFFDKITRRLNQMGIRKEEANLEKNYKNILKRTVGFPTRSRSRSRSRGRSRRQKHKRKTRKA